MDGYEKKQQDGKAFAEALQEITTKIKNEFARKLAQERIRGVVEGAEIMEAVKQPA